VIKEQNNDARNRKHLSPQEKYQILIESPMRIQSQIANTSVSCFKCTHDRIMLSSLNEYAHLELHSHGDLITYR